MYIHTELYEQKPRGRNPDEMIRQGGKPPTFLPNDHQQVYT